MDTSTNSKVYELASAIYDAFESKERTNGETFYALKDGSPQWMTDVIHEAHGDMMPDDTIYAIIHDVVRALNEVDAEDHETREPVEVVYEDCEPDIYTSALTHWLSLHLNHIAYVNDYIREYGASGESDIEDLMRGGQKLQIDEVGAALVRALENCAESSEDEEREEPDYDAYLAKQERAENERLDAIEDEREVKKFIEDNGYHPDEPKPTNEDPA